MQRERGTNVGMPSSTPVEVAAAKVGQVYGADPYTVAWAVLRELEAAGFRIVDAHGRDVDLYGDAR